MNTIRIGSRESKLAVIQSEMVMDAIRQYAPELSLELITMKTTGDRILDRTLDQIGGKGLFVKELDRALLEKNVDLTVHSSKDLPMETDPRLPLVAFSKRADPRDVLVLPEQMDQLDFSRPIGCSSFRRKLQLERIFPEAAVAPVRGNIQTRLAKLDRGDYSALVLAGAGLQRLGLENRISRYFSTEEILPAAGQGILAVQARTDFDSSCLREFNDPDGRDCLKAERAFVKTLDGGCSSPVAAYGVVVGDTLTLKGMYVAKNKQIFFETVSGERNCGEMIGAELARKMRRDHQ